MSSLEGRVAVVTGGGRGLGRATAAELAAAGAAVAVLSRTPDELQRVAGEIGGIAVAADVSRAYDVGAAVAQVEEQLGQVDVLVNNAGVVWPLGRTAEVDPDEWEQAIAVNLIGAFRLTRAVLPGMLARGYGRVVNISTGAATQPGMPSASAYSVSKAGLDMLTVHLAHEVDGTGVTVNAVRPGTLDTPMQTYMRSLPREQVGDAFHTRFHGLYETGGLVDPREPARFVVEMVVSDRNGDIVDVRDLRR